MLASRWGQDASDAHPRRDVPSLSLVICTGTCVHAALAEHFGGLPRAVWSGCCTACILQGSARLSGRVDGLGAQLAAVGASASEEHERAAAALAASPLAKRLSRASRARRGAPRRSRSRRASTTSRLRRTVAPSCPPSTTRCASARARRSHRSTSCRIMQRSSIRCWHVGCSCGRRTHCRTSPRAPTRASR